MKPKAAFFVVALTIIAVIVWLAVGRKKSEPDKPATPPVTDKTPPPATKSVEISFEYSTEKKESKPRCRSSKRTTRRSK